MSFVLTRRRRRAREEALAWLARLKRGLREREGPELLAWLRRRAHRTLIAKAAAEWHGPEVLAVLAEIFPIDPQLIDPPRRRNPVIIAAAVLFSVCLTVMPFVVGHRYLPLILSEKPKAGSLIESLGDVYATSAAVTRRLTLEDGSRIELNRKTRLAVLYSEHARTALVSSGEATFTVTGEPYRPFTVIAAGRALEANAAMFDVRVSAPNSMQLTVIRGTVRIFPSIRRESDDGSVPRSDDPSVFRPLLVGPLQMLMIEPDGESARAITERDVLTQLSWRKAM